ncbi:MAG: cytochrome c [Bacteroidota bacterium]
MTKSSFAILCFLLAFLYFSCDINPYKQGEGLYLHYCASCHMEEGQGLKGLFPPIAGSDYLEANIDQLSCIIKNGLVGEIVVNGRTYDQPMLAIKDINDIEIANLINFINYKWRNVETYISPEDVRTQLEECQ